MWFWWLMFAFDILIPVIMLVSGRIMWRHPPKDINGFVGYRTARSMKNMDTWKFAHEYLGRLWWRIGFIMLIPSIAAHLLSYSKSENFIAVLACILETIQCIVLIASIFPAERALKRNFTKEGIRRAETQKESA